MAQFSMEIMRLTGSVLGGNQHLNVVDRQEFDALVDDIKAIETDADLRATGRLTIVISQFGFEAEMTSSSARSERTWDIGKGHQFKFRMPSATEAAAIGRTLKTDAARMLVSIKMNLMALNALTDRGFSKREPTIKRLTKAIDEAALGFVRRLAKPL